MSTSQEVNNSTNSTDEVNESLQSLYSVFSKVFQKGSADVDPYFANLLSTKNFVHIQDIINAPNVQNITKDTEFIRNSIYNYKGFYISKDIVKANLNKSVQNIIILRDISSSLSPDVIIQIYSSNKEIQCPVPVSAKAEYNNTWYVTFASEEDARTAQRVSRNLSYGGKPLKSRLKSDINSKPYYNSNNLNGRQELTPIEIGGVGPIPPPQIPSPTYPNMYYPRLSPQYLSPYAGAFPSPVYSPAGVDMNGYPIYYQYYPPNVEIQTSPYQPYMNQQAPRQRAPRNNNNNTMNNMSQGRNNQQNRSNYNRQPRTYTNSNGFTPKDSSIEGVQQPASSEYSEQSPIIKEETNSVQQSFSAIDEPEAVPAEVATETIQPEQSISRFSPELLNQLDSKITEPTDSTQLEKKSNPKSSEQRNNRKNNGNNTNNRNNSKTNRSQNKEKPSEPKKPQVKLNLEKDFPTLGDQDSSKTKNSGKSPVVDYASVVRKQNAPTLNHFPTPSQIESEKVEVVPSLPVAAPVVKEEPQVVPEPTPVHIEKPDSVPAVEEQAFAVSFGSFGLNDSASAHLNSTKLVSEPTPTPVTSEPPELAPIPGKKSWADALKRSK